MHMVITDKIPEATRHTDLLRKRVNKGIGFIKDGRTKEAVSFYGDKDGAKQSGITLSNGPSLPVNFRRTFSPAELKPIADSFDSQSYTAGNYIVLPQFISDKIRLWTGNMPPELSKDVALVCADKWLEAFRNMSDQSLMGYLDPHIDTAAYIQGTGVGLSDNYLERHRRREVLTGKPSDPKLYPQSLRTGSYVSVLRSTGEQESDWQLYKVHPSRRNVLVRKGDSIKEVTMAKLLIDNPMPVISPFSEVKSLYELYRTINSIGGIQVFDEYQNTRKLVEIIEAVRKKIIGPEYITTVGDLRGTVMKLLRTN